MHVERTVLLQLKDEERGVTLRVERWFMAADHRVESTSKAALIWDAGKDSECVVLLDAQAACAIIGELVLFA